MEFVDKLNLIFKDKYKYNNDTILKLDEIAAAIYDEYVYIEQKLEKYKQLEEYLKEELEALKLAMVYIVNKTDPYIKINFFTYATYYEVHNKSTFDKIIHWIKRKLSPSAMTTHSQEIESNTIKTHDFKPFEIQYNIIENYFVFVFDNNFSTRITEKNYDQFVKLLRISMIHEMTHQRDFLDVSIREIITNNRHAPYLEQNTEVKAWAAATIEELKLNGLDDEEIEKVLLEPKSNMRAIKTTVSLREYYNAFYSTNRPMYYVFASECLDALNKHYKNPHLG